MPQPRLTLAQLQATADALTRYPTIAAGAASLKLSEGTFRSRKRIVQQWQRGGYEPAPDYPTQPPDAVEGPMPSTLFDERWATFCRWIGRSRASVKPPTRPAAARKVILHTGDWHIPHMHEAAFRATLEQNEDADVCVVGGDALNCSAFSRFIESDLVNPRDEFASLTLALQAVAERYPEVHINIGNHPDRIRKYLSKRLDPWAMFLCRTNPIQFVVDGLRKEHGIHHLRVATPIVLDHDQSNWATFVGDCAFTHAETHGKLHLRPAENTARWLRKWERFLPTRPRVVVQEHNHRGGMFYDDELGCLLIQAPCLSMDVPYQTAGDLKYAPNQRGWVRLVQVNGVTQINESRYYLVNDDGASRAA